MTVDRRALLRALATPLAAGFAIALIAFLLLGFASLLGMQPCAASRDDYAVTLLARPIALAAAIGLMLVARHDPRPRWFVAAFALPLLAWGAHAVTSAYEARWQAQCRRWPVEEALRQCRADPAWFVLGRDRYGYRQATLVARGDAASRSWSCLSQWARWSNWGSVPIDPSVYGPPR